MTDFNRAAPQSDGRLLRFPVVAARCVLLAVLASLPWALAGTDLRVQIVATTGLLAATVLTGLATFAGASNLGVPTRAGRIVEAATTAFLVLALVQACRPELPDRPVRDVLELLPFSAYPAQTRAAAANLLLGISTLFLASRLFSTVESRTVLYGAAAVTGAATAVFGIAQKLQWDGRVYGVFETTGHIFAAFPNRNAACGYLALTVSCAAAQISLPRGDDHQASAPLGLLGMLAGAFALAGAVGSGSRGGLLAAAVSALVGGWACYRGGRSSWQRAGLFAVGCVIAAVLTFWLSLSEEVMQRLRSLRAAGLFADGRWEHWSETLPAVGDRPLWGAGFGTYDYATLAYVSEYRGSWFRHADNQYLEVLVESGGIGFSIAVIAITTLGVAAIGLFRQPRTPDRIAAGTSLAAALSGQIVLAFTDFGILMPANLTLMAAIVGSSLSKPRSPARCQRYLAGVVMICLALGSTAAARELILAERVARVEPILPASRSDVSTTPEYLQAVSEILEAALAARPDDAVGHRKLAEMLVAGYRQETFARLLGTGTRLSDDQLWAATGLPQLYGAACSAADLQPLREDPAVKRWLVPARDHYRQAQRSCPRLPRVDAPLATLTFLDSDHPELDTKRLEQVLVRFPADADRAYTVGLMAWESGDLDFAGRAWRRTLTLTPRYDAAIREVAATRLPLPLQTDVLLPDDPAVIVRFASARPPAEAPFWNPVALADHAVALLGPDVTVGESLILGRAEVLRGDVPQAVAAFGQAVLEEPRDANLRAEYADVLWKARQFDDAIRELRIAAGLEPNRRDREKALERRIAERARLPGAPE